EALRAVDREAAGPVASALGRELLPDDPYDDWAAGPRERLAGLHRDLLRLAGRWDDLVALDPADEQAHLELMRRHAEAGNRSAALHQYERMARALRAELGVEPSPAAVDLRDHLLAGPLPQGPSGGPGPR